MALAQVATSTLWDTVIVGGIPGTMTAAELVKCGVSVLILDKKGDRVRGLVVEHGRDRRLGQIRH